MKLIVEKDYQGLSKRAADIIREEMNRKPDLVLGYYRKHTCRHV